MYPYIQKSLVEDRCTELRRVAQLSARRSESAAPRRMAVVSYTRTAVGGVFIAIGTRLAAPKTAGLPRRTAS